MKKFLIILFAFLGATLVLYALILVPRYRFGYVENKQVFHHVEIDGDIVKLSDGRILALGKRAYGCKEDSICKDFITNINEYPFEFYNQETGEVTEAVIKDRIMFEPKGIALDNGKFLLTLAHNAEDKSYPQGLGLGEMENKKPPYLYDSVAVVDSRTMKVEKLIKKKTGGNEIIYPGNDVFFTLLGNGKVLYLNHYDSKNAEIFDIEKGTSKVLKDFKIDAWKLSAVPKDKNKALIFGGLPFFDDKLHIFEYDDTTETVKPINDLEISRTVVKKINENEVIIAGPKDKEKTMIAIYDIQKNEFKIIGKLPRKRNYIGVKVGRTYGVQINDRYFAFAGGDDGSHYFLKIYRNSYILDLKTHKLYTGPEFPSFCASNSNRAITLDKGGILLGPYAIFHLWKK